MVEIGDTIQPGMPMMEIAQTKFLRIEAQIPARLVPNLKRGSFVDAKLDVGDTFVKARVAQIYPIADILRHTVTVKFDLPKGVPGGPGMYAEVFIKDTLQSIKKSVPIISADSLIYRGSLPYVFVINNNEKIQLRIVRAGKKIGNNKVAILSGLVQGERVVTNPPLNLRSGILIDDIKDKQSTNNNQKNKQGSTFRISRQNCKIFYKLTTITTVIDSIIVNWYYWFDSYSTPRRSPNIRAYG